MDSISSLIASHMALRKLEKELKERRLALINSNKYIHSSVGYHFEYCDKYKEYAGFAVKFQDETATFNKLIEQSIINNNNNSDNEIVSNIPESTASSSGNSMSYQQLLSSSQPISAVNSTQNIEKTDAIIINNKIEKEEKKKEIKFIVKQNKAPIITNKISINSTQKKIDKINVNKIEREEKKENKEEKEEFAAFPA
eukprot:85474_1